MPSGMRNMPGILFDLLSESATMTEIQKQFLENSKPVEWGELKEKYPQTVEIADRLSDMILFHRRVRKNGDESMKVWED